MSKKPSFSEALKKWRSKKGVSQPQAADLAGIKVSTYRNYEQGRTEPLQALQDAILSK